MRKITNYSYSVDGDGTLTIYTTVNNRDYTIAELEECLKPKAKDKDICNLIEEVLNDLGYELVEEK